MTKISISADEALQLHGVGTNHECMPNGELRFRLTNSDGNDYIRTNAGSTGAWQKAHFHSTIQETYVVQTGWMAIAEELDGKANIRVYWPSETVTTKPRVVHNVYLPANAVIHTVKHGATGANDWTESLGFTQTTVCLSERDILAGLGSTGERKTSDARFESYVLLYNNLDDLIWRIPGVLATGAAVLIGFAGSVMSKDKLPEFPPVLMAGMFFFIGLLFFLSAYSISRIRRHHLWAGDELAKMEPDGYFHRRRNLMARAWPIAAPVLFLWTYALLWVAFWALAVVALGKYQWLVALISWRP